MRMACIGPCWVDGDELNFNTVEILQCDESPVVLPLILCHITISLELSGEVYTWNFAFSHIVLAC